MRDILLKENGSINEEKINDYVNRFGIDTPYDNPDSIFHRDTLLSAAMYDDEIKPDVKLKLVSYLLDKGAKINDYANVRKGSLLAVALSQNNVDLAKLLLDISRP